MTPTEIHVDIKELEGVLAALPIFSRDIKQELNEIQLSVSALEKFWQDEEFRVFADSFKSIRLSLEAMDQELVNHHAGLKEDLNALIAYQKVTS